MAEINFDDKSFEDEVLKSDVPVLVDFWAPWCGPCTMIGPVINELAEAYEGKKIKIGKLNVDDNPDTAQNYGVMSIPSLIFFVDGEVKETLVGIQSKESIEEKINEIIS